MSKPLILILEWLPAGMLARLTEMFPGCTFVEARDPAIRDERLAEAVVTYGMPPVARLQEATSLRWIQLISAGVPQDLCPAAKVRGLTVTNLSGLYGASIAEHAIGMMLMLSRNLHTVLRNQQLGRWDRTVAHGMRDLHGSSLAIVGLGNIGQNIARLAKAHGMRVTGCRRTARPTPYVDRTFPREAMCDMFAEADYIAVAAPFTAQTEGMLGPAEFAAMKAGVIYINVSRGPIAQEKALLDALQTSHVAAAGLDVFAVEPLAPAHPFWSMPQVVVSPHFSGETINQSALPAERFSRNLSSWLAGRDLEGRINLDWGY